MMAAEEGANLLPNAPERVPDEGRRARRSQTLRVVVGIVSALAIVAGSVVAVDLLVEKQQATTVGTTSLSAQPAKMEAQSLWCSARATLGCLFSSDRDKCKEEVHAKCDPDDDDDEHHGDGSGSGSGVGSGSGSHPGGPNVGDETHPHKKKKHHKKPKKTPAPSTTTAAPTTSTNATETTETTEAPEPTQAPESTPAV